MSYSSELQIAAFEGLVLAVYDHELYIQKNHLHFFPSSISYMFEDPLRPNLSVCTIDLSGLCFGFGLIVPPSPFVVLYSLLTAVI